MGSAGLWYVDGNSARQLRVSGMASEDTDFTVLFWREGEPGFDMRRMLYKSHLMFEGQSCTYVF